MSFNIRIEAPVEYDTAGESTVRFPVACPACGRESLATIPTRCVTRALRLGELIFLYSECHELLWAARELELEQIQQYFNVAWVHTEVPAIKRA